MNVKRCYWMLAALIAVGGCQQERHSDPQAEGPQGIFRPANSQDVSATEYRVGPPDKLALRAPGIKELDGIVTQIRPDGKISVQLLGELYVANKTPEEIGKALTQTAAKYYNNVEVKVEVADYASKFYQVFGTAVRDGGKKPYTGRNTVISALASAGFNEDAWPQQVSISRPATKTHPRATAIINMKKMYMTGDTTQNYLLEENDIVYVPNSPLAQWGKDTRNILGPLTQAGGAMQMAAPTRTGP